MNKLYTMLSRFSARAIFSHKPFFGLAVIRSSSHAPVETAPVEQKKFVESSYVDFDENKPISVLSDDLIPHPNPYDGPQRDYVNFPNPVRLDNQSPTRHLIFPEEWFKFMYPKLGVTGPYTLGLGFITFLISKEYYLIDDVEFKHTAAFLFWVYVLCKTPLGKMIADFEFKSLLEEEKERNDQKQQTLQDRVDAIEHEKKEQWRQEGKKILFQAKREGVALQLEAVYRQNVINFYNQVKKRLDYQVEVSKIDARVKQQFMVDYVINKVKEAIAAQSEKETLRKCIADLNLLAAKA